MRVYFGWWQIGWSWVEWIFLTNRKKCFLFKTKQKRNFDFGFSKNTFFLKLKSDSWPCWHLVTLPLNYYQQNRPLIKRIIIFNLYSGLVPSEFNIVRLSLKERVKFWLRIFLTQINYWPRKYFPFRTIGFCYQGWPVGC